MDGVISDDSDSFLFGAKHVYRNIFQNNKFVEAFSMGDIKSELGLTREDLIAFAYFVGSDYTEGIHGIGLVNAMEIISSFPMKNTPDQIMTGLKLFKYWSLGFDFEAAAEDLSLSEFDEHTYLLINDIDDVEEIKLILSFISPDHLNKIVIF